MTTKQATPRQMTEPEAWREVARRWVEREEGNARGLCRIVSQLEIDRAISYRTFLQMERRVVGYLPSESAWAYRRESYVPLASYVERHREARALAALWLSLEAEEDQV